MADEKNKVILTKKPKGVTVIEGFPGIGLVGTIATGFLIDHLQCEKIGSHYFENQAAPSMIAIHECKLVDPIGIYYNKKYNIVIIHAITSPAGQEWRAADLILDVCNQLGAKEIITIEGVGSTEEPAKNSSAYYFTKDKASAKKMDDKGHHCLNEGIIVGSTAAIILKSQLKTTCMFAETHTKMPDSKAAAQIITLIDDYLGLKVDPKPLLKQAEEFEKKLKTIVEQGSKAQDLRQKKKFAYIG